MVLVDDRVADARSPRRWSAHAMPKDAKKDPRHALDSAEEGSRRSDKAGKLGRAFYEQELRKLQIELVKLQEWCAPRDSAS